MTKKSRFRGGIHQTNGFDKELTANKDIITFVPDVVTISMKQGLGPACNCVVKDGDIVEQGQLIGEAKHFLSATVHASVTGKVLEVTDSYCKIQVHQCSLPDKDSDYNTRLIDISHFSKNEIIDKIEQAGIVGMGGAGFPAHVKYRTKSAITTLLINAVECEPYLTCDEHIILEYGYSLINGALLLKKASGAVKAYICIEDNKPHCIEKLKHLLSNVNDNIEVLSLATCYPQGGEKQLIYASMGVEVPSGKLPADVGAIVSNVQTAKAVADMVLGKIPSVSRCITITGDVTKPDTYLVTVGTNIGELVAKCGGVRSKDNKVILGGPMTGRCIGRSVSSEEILDNVSKVSGGLIVLEGKFYDETACIKCEECVHACPIGLNPTRIDFAIRNNDLGLCESLDATECIACGCCSFVCPAQRELTYHTVKARDAVKAKQREEANSGKQSI